MDNNAVFDKKARIVLLNPENKRVMINKIMDEWYSIKKFNVSESLLNCQLCGRRNKYIFYIRNKLTDVELHNEINDTLSQLNLSKTTYIKNGGNLDEVYGAYWMLCIDRVDIFF